MCYKLSCCKSCFTFFGLSTLRPSFSSWGSSVWRPPAISHLLWQTVGWFLHQAIIYLLFCNLASQSLYLSTISSDCRKMLDYVTCIYLFVMMYYLFLVRCSLRHAFTVHKVYISKKIEGYEIRYYFLDLVHLVRALERRHCKIY